MTTKMRSLRTMSIAEQRDRAAQLDEIRLQRRLTDAEQDEADRLATANYMRVWRAQQAATERRLAGAGL